MNVAAEGEGNEDVVEVPARSHIKRNTLHSRAQSVSSKILCFTTHPKLNFVRQRLDQRKRKRTKCTEYQHAKFDAAFTLTAMSDHEDDPNPDPTKPRKFILRAPGY